MYTRDEIIDMISQATQVIITDIAQYYLDQGYEDRRYTAYIDDEDTLVIDYHN